jgi:hypothetical protein
VWGSWKIFFIGLEVQKPVGSSVSYALLPHEKLSYKIKLMTPPKNIILDRFASFFLLGYCHLVLSKFSIKSCLSSAMAFFLPKKQATKMLQL